jgi:hypothetical protein
MEAKLSAITATALRALWHFNRTPLARLAKRCLRLLRHKEVAKRRALAGVLPVSPQMRDLALRLNTEGYAFVNRIIDPGLLAAMAEDAAQKLAEADALTEKQLSRHKSFWVRLTDVEMRDGAFPASSPYVRFATQPGVLALLAQALGELPQLDYVLLTLSRPSNAELTYSQLWHRDHDDVRTIKLFVYLTDVKSEADGPFTFLPGPPSDRFGFSLQSHLADDHVLHRVRSEEIIRVVAPRLTAFMVETSRCLHMGSRMAAGHQRLLYTATYITVPRMYPEPPPRFTLDDSLDEVTRCVLAAPG